MAGDGANASPSRRWARRPTTLGGLSATSHPAVARLRLVTFAAAHRATTVFAATMSRVLCETYSRRDVAPRWSVAQTFSEQVRPAVRTRPAPMLIPDRNALKQRPFRHGLRDCAFAAFRSASARDTFYGVEQCAWHAQTQLFAYGHTTGEGTPAPGSLTLRYRSLHLPAFISLPLIERFRELSSSDLLTEETHSSICSHARCCLRPTASRRSTRQNVDPRSGLSARRDNTTEKTRPKRNNVAFPNWNFHRKINILCLYFSTVWPMIFSAYSVRNWRNYFTLPASAVLTAEWEW